MVNSKIYKNRSGYIDDVTKTVGVFFQFTV